MDWRGARVLKGGSRRSGSHCRRRKWSGGRRTGYPSRWRGMGQHSPGALELAPKGAGQQMRGAVGGRLDPDWSTIGDPSAVITNRVVGRQPTARHQENGGDQRLKPSSRRHLLLTR